MPAEFKKGDIFASGLRAFAQGCNCAGVMDAGVAIAFKKKWPAMFDDYKARCADGRFHLGDVLAWSEGDVTVYNIAIQEHWKKKATLAALTRGLKKVVELAQVAGIDQIGLPRIGTGLGGLEWPRVKSVVTQVGETTPINLVVFEQFIRARAETEG